MRPNIICTIIALTGFTKVAVADCSKVQLIPSPPSKDALAITTASEVVLCYDTSKNRFWSEQCSEVIKAKKCEAQKQLNGTVLIAKKLDTPMGTPAAHLCQQAKGRHLILKLKENLFEEGICYFEKDKSFVNDEQAIWINSHAL